MFDNLNTVCKVNFEIAFSFSCKLTLLEVLMIISCINVGKMSMIDHVTNR